MSSDFEEYGASWEVLFFLMHLLGQLLCLTSNGTIAVVILKTSHLRTVSSMLVLALTFSDILLSILWNVMDVGGTGRDGDISAINSNTSEATTGEATAVEDGELIESSRDERDGSLLQSHPQLCVLVGFLWQSVLATSTLYQALVACDRYLFIVHPLRYEAFVTRKKALVVLVLLAFLALVLPSTTLISGGTYVYMWPVGTCVSHITWYVMFIFLVYLPSLAVTLVSNLGIWSLCVRQLNTPGRARLVREVSPHTDAFNVLEENGRRGMREVPPHTDAFNLMKENGRVAVRRDIVDDFSCCIPALCRNTPAGEKDSTNCLKHLVQNSSLMFVEGFIAAVPISSASNEVTSAACFHNVTSPNFVCPAPPTVLPPSPSPSEHAKKRHHRESNDTDCPKNNNSLSTSNGKDAKEPIKDEEDPQKNGTDRSRQPHEEPKSKINHQAKENTLRSEPSVSSHSAEGDQARTEKHLTLSAKKTVSDPAQAERIPLTPRLAHKSISSPSATSSRGARSRAFHKTPSSFLLSQDLTDSLSKASNGSDGHQEENRGLLSHGGAGLATRSYPSTTSLRSVISDGPGIFRCSSAIAAEPATGTGTKLDKAQILSTIDSPIVHWMIPPVRLGVQRSVSEIDRKKGGEEDQECDVIAERRAPLRRRAKTAVLVALPVVSLFLTLLPLVGVQTLLVAGVWVSRGATAWVCRVMYFIIPSLNPFLIGLTNRHLRHAIADNICCKHNSL